MHNYIMTLGIVVFAILCLTVSSDLSTYARSTAYLKEDIEIAIHDASLQLDNEALAEGSIVFDESLARQTFKESLEMNTGMDEESYEIIEFEIFDDYNSTFPVTYESNETGFKDTFLYPTVLAIISTSTNEYFYTSQDKKVTRVASYTYDLSNAIMTGSSIDSLSTFIPSEPNIHGFHWVVPFTENITSPFSLSRKNPVTGIVKPHKGTDIAINGVLNQPTVSALDGTVTYAGVMGGYGNLVEIDHHNGLVTRYAHLNAIHVTKGQEVKGGQAIGLIGSTGNSTGAHLHFETILHGEHKDPMLFFQ